MPGIKIVAQPFELQAEIKNNKNVIALFSATWCGPCKTIKPVYKQFSEDSKYAGIQFLYVDIDESDDICSVYKIRSVPTFIMFGNEKIVEQFAGTDKNKLEQVLNSRL